jgi:cytidylate kinase
VSRSIQAIVEEQVGRWRQGQRSEADTGACVAISHLPGAGGAELGRSVAERLGYGFFDREIVEAIVKDAGTQGQLAAGLDEHVRGLVERYVIDTVRARSFAEGDYLKSVVRVVGTLARRGRAVLLGRGSACILTRNEALRVLVVAPREVRLERIARERGLASAAAREHLEHEEADRAEFFRHHFGVRQDDPALYDLSINTGSLSMALATELVVQALAGQFPKRVAAAGERHVASP